MDKIVYVIFALAVAVSCYFWGVQSGQAKAQQAEVQQQAIQRAQSLSEQLQYVTLLNLEKTDELNVLIRSRILSEKTRLEMDLARPELAENKILKDAVNMAQQVLIKEQ
ncbi:MAG: hypothetical protein HWE27_01610 [Gammaproteobacteria bacterium]|nr:hypothetical protein [Gammaproteobacteria bacterium]